MGEGLVEEKRNDGRRIKNLLEANNRMLEEKRALQKQVMEADAEALALVRELGHMRAIIEKDPELLNAYNDPDMLKLDEWFRMTFKDAADILVMENEGMATAVIRVWNQARDKWHRANGRAHKIDENMEAVIAARNLLADDLHLEKGLHNHTRNRLSAVLDGFVAFKDSVAAGRIKTTTVKNAANRSKDVIP